MFQSFRFRFQGFSTYGLGSRVLEFKVQGIGSRVSGFKVWGLAARVAGSRSLGVIWGLGTENEYRHVPAAFLKSSLLSSML